MNNIYTRKTLSMTTHLQLNKKTYWVNFLLLHWGNIVSVFRNSPVHESWQIQFKQTQTRTADKYNNLLADVAPRMPCSLIICYASCRKKLMEVLEWIVKSEKHFYISFSVDICTKCHGNSLIVVRWWDISMWVKVVDLSTDLHWFPQVWPQI